MGMAQGKQGFGRVKNINKANSPLKVSIGIPVQSDHVYYKPSISVDLKIVFTCQLRFQPYLCEGQCLEDLTVPWKLEESSNRAHSNH